jgi:F-type H+-transporting ATPase subunit delta
VPASGTALRYATAAFSVANERGELDQWLATLNEFARVLQMPSARVVFASPAVPGAQKVAAINRLLPNAPPLVLNFLRILATRDRLDEVPGIAQALADQINRRRGIVIAEVTTAIPLDPELEKVIAQRLASYLHREPDKITLRTHVDPSLIGGVVARVGDQVIDDSVRGRLERLRRTLSRAS